MLILIEFDKRKVTEKKNLKTSIFLIFQNTSFEFKNKFT